MQGAGIYTRSWGDVNHLTGLLWLIGEDSNTFSCEWKPEEWVTQMKALTDLQCLRGTVFYSLSVWLAVTGVGAHGERHKWKNSTKHLLIDEPLMGVLCIFSLLFSLCFLLSIQHSSTALPSSVARCDGKGGIMGEDQRAKRGAKDTEAD